MLGAELIGEPLRSAPRFMSRCRGHSTASEVLLYILRPESVYPPPPDPVVGDGPALGEPPHRAWTDAESGCNIEGIQRCSDYLVVGVRVGRDNVDHRAILAVPNTKCVGKFALRQHVVQHHRYCLRAQPVDPTASANA